MSDLSLKLSNVEIRFTRRNYENIAEKANVLITMLNNNKIHPKLAFEHSGLFIDPELAYSTSMSYAEEQEKKTLEQMNSMAGVREHDENEQVSTEEEEDDV